MRPAPMFMWPTSELPMMPGGKPTYTIGAGAGELVAQLAVKRHFGARDGVEGVVLPLTKAVEDNEKYLRSLLRVHGAKRLADTQ